MYSPLNWTSHAKDPKFDWHFHTNNQMNRWTKNQTWCPGLHTYSHTKLHVDITTFLLAIIFPVCIHVQSIKWEKHITYHTLTSHISFITYIIYIYISHTSHVSHVYTLNARCCGPFCPFLTMGCVWSNFWPAWPAPFPTEGERSELARVS